MYERVLQARERIRERIYKTPVINNASLDKMIGKSVYFKCENFQLTGSFKIRGAFNKMLQLSSEEKKKGVITVSSGNHGQAVAYAASVLQIPCVVIMPENSVKAKIKSVEEFGAEIIFCGRKPADREIKLKEIQGKRERTLVHPFSDYKIIAGAGTVALELIEEVPDLDMIIVPIGGGGLISGTLMTVLGKKQEDERHKNLKVIGAEPEMASDAYRSWKAQSLIEELNPQTIADGLRMGISHMTFEIISEYIDSIVTVTENEIKEALTYAFNKLKLVIEPSSSVAISPLLVDKIYNDSTEKIGVIISGGNIDLPPLF